MSKEKAIVHINNVSKILGTKRIKLSEATVKHLQNELHLTKKELETIMNQEYIIDKELKDMLVFWFEDIEKLSSTLTSGNVSHQGATIRNKAIRCSKFIQEFCKTKEE